jgi:recombination protein RecA
MAEKTKLEILAEVKKNLEKKFGEGTVMGAHDAALDIESISTGSIGLDRALGIGGLPKGRIIEIYGPESSGKTTVASHVIAEAHKGQSGSTLCFY